MGAAVAVCLTSPRAAASQDRTPQRFFVRASLGGGYGTNAASALDPMFTVPIDLTFTGGGVIGAFSMGATVTPGLAVHLDAGAVSLLAPAVRLQGMEIPLAGNADFTTSMSMVGAGVTWVHRANVWISVSGGVAQISAELPFERAAGHALSALGGGAQLMVGYDWRIAEHWYLGAALHGMGVLIPEASFGAADVTATWVGAALGLALSVGTR